MTSTATPMPPMAMPINMRNKQKRLSHLSQKLASFSSFTALYNISDGNINTTAVPRAPPPTALTNPRSVNWQANAVITDSTTMLSAFRFVLVCISSLTENRSKMPSRVPMNGNG